MREFLMEVYHDGSIRKELINTEIRPHYALLSRVLREAQLEEIQRIEDYAEKVRESYSRPGQPRFPSFGMEVKILNWPAPHMAMHGAKICVNQQRRTPADYDYPELEEYLLARIQDNEGSVLEHTTLSVECDGLSRAFLIELSRHRLLSLSVQSTRWALKSTWGKGEWVFPPKLCDTSDVEAIGYREEAGELLEKIEQFVEKLRTRYGNDTAKYFIPECAPTHFLITANLREWRYIIKLRTEKKVLPEFQEFCHRVVDAAENSMIRGESLIGKLLIA